MARLQIGGGSTRVGEVYLDMLFRQRALDNARAEAAQRAQIESARLQASERNAERDAQMQMLQMQQQANLAREARAATQAENQAQRQFSAEQQAASLGWDKEKLNKELASRESLASKADAQALAMEAKRHANNLALAAKQDELAQRRNNLELVATIAQSDPDADVESLKDMTPVQLASYAGKSVKKAKTAEEQKALLDRYASSGMDIPELMSDAQRAVAAQVQSDRQRVEAREDKAKAEARNDVFAIKRAEAKMRHAEAITDLLIKSQVKDAMDNIVFNRAGYDEGKRNLDAGLQASLESLKSGAEAITPAPAKEVRPVGMGLAITQTPVQKRDLGVAYNRFRMAGSSSPELGGAGIMRGINEQNTAETDLLAEIDRRLPELSRAEKLQVLEDYRLQKHKEKWSGIPSWGAQQAPLYPRLGE